MSKLYFSFLTLLGGKIDHFTEQEISNSTFADTADSEYISEYEGKFEVFEVNI
jgi:hypothetical protein